MFNARVIAGSFKAPLTPAALRTRSRRPSQLTCRFSAIFTHYDYSVFTSLLQGSCVFFLLLRVFVDLDSIEVRMRGKKSLNFALTLLIKHKERTFLFYSSLDSPPRSEYKTLTFKSSLYNLFIEAIAQLIVVGPKNKIQ